MAEHETGTPVITAPVTTASARRMPKAEEKAAATTTAVPDALQMWSQLSQNAWKVLAQGIETTIEGGLEVQKTLQTYAETCMQRQVELIEDLREAANVSEAIQVQADFSRTAVEDGLKTATELARIGYRAAGSGWSAAA